MTQTEKQKALIKATADMFEKEYQAWFFVFYKETIKKMTTPEAARMRQKMMPVWLAGFQMGIEGSMIDELFIPVMNELKRRAK